MKKYNVINNAMGWLMFAIAAVTYLLTIEPTASFWDCPEFISQGYKLEIGHPPGNPIFMLAARFAINFVSNPQYVSVAVNVMNAILSALTILLLFWTVTHLVKKLVVTDGEEDGMSLVQYLIVMGSGAVGALAYTWSDTFWFSAVEAEVYAFSSFCTALVFWLILKWENRANEANSDRYLILIAYVIGVSIAVHLLNLLCIPAIVLVFYYKKWKDTNVKGSLIALGVSFVIIALILYGLVPGFVKAAQAFELFFVNSLGMPYNSGVLAYTILDFAVFAWCLYELYRQKSSIFIKLSFFSAIVLSGMLFFGNAVIATLLVIALGIYLFKYCERIPVRIFTLTALSILVIFIGYSSYALILIRSNSHTPINQNTPDNVFSLSTYLNREQYGDRPLFYGQTFNSGIVYQVNSNNGFSPVVKEGKKLYAKDVTSTHQGHDRYFLKGRDEKYKTSPELDMLFPRMYSGSHIKEYTEWVNLKGEMVNATTRLDREGNVIETSAKLKPTFAENLRFFLDYQLNYMYWRYFMWNFAGRQNDNSAQGEITNGNWICGIPFIDNLRLGDQSLLPDDLGAGNKAHNVFYLLPLILGIIGLLWQAYKGKRGIEQFWVVFFLFFMTGIAIVLYLNQTPSQPRERDYAFAGSFYAYAIWIGMGVAGLWHFVMAALNNKRHNLPVAAASVVLGLAVPLQMVSQTWDDHDRSGRYPARDFGMNYLSSLDDNAIIFTNGDNDTFPLWYCQEVEGYRTDVRVINLSYLSTDWYIDQMRYPTYDSAPVPMLANDTTYAYERRQFNYFIEPDTTLTPVLSSLNWLYSPEYQNNAWGYPEFKYPVMYIPVDADVAVKQGVVDERKRAAIQESIIIDLLNEKYVGQDMAISCSGTMVLDILASSISQGWKRPVYFAMTVPERYYLGLSPYMQNTGMAYEVTPIRQLTSDGEITTNTDKAYRNVTERFRWAGIDKAEPGSLYLDETIRRMVATTRSSMNDLAYMLTYEGAEAKLKVENGNSDLSADEKAKLTDFAADRFAKARKVLMLMEEKLPVKACPYSVHMGFNIAQTWDFLAQYSDNKADKEHMLDVLEAEVEHWGMYARFYQSLDNSYYSRLRLEDRYIDQRMFPEMVYYLNEVSSERCKRVTDKLTKQGVNIKRSLNFLAQANEQQNVQAQQEEEPQEEEVMADMPDTSDAVW
ncbi:MAG: DUF2723 domain-containing protein [Muribaculaceae bacterium]